jgi:hypothetical protein
MTLKIIKYIFNFAGIIMMIFLAVREYSNVTKLADCCLLYDLKEAQKESLFPIFTIYMIVVICGNWTYERTIEEKHPKEFLLLSILQLLVLALIIFAQIEYVKLIVE